jgi:hypothetical protein
MGLFNLSIFLLGSLQLAPVTSSAQPQHLLEKPVLPKIIFHSGKKSTLLTNEAANTVPEIAWTEHIMGIDNKTGRPRMGGYHALAPHRRGLYGFHIPRENYMKNEEPWFMGVVIRDECRKSELAIDDGTYQTKHFKHWASQNLSPADTQKFTQCFDSVGVLNGNYKAFVAYHITNGNSDPICMDVLGRYYHDSSFRVALDTSEGVFLEGSYCIRDRSCIEEILGSPKEVIELLMKYPHPFYTTSPKLTKMILSAGNDLLLNNDVLVLESLIRFLRQFPVSQIESEENRTHFATLVQALEGLQFQM